MPRARHITQDEQTSERDNISLTSVIAVSVSDYANMKKLPGSKKDMEMVEELFCKNGDLSLYKKNFKKLIDPSTEELRREIVNYSKSRSARGDILIFYFSGHGTVIGNEFAFCLSDTTFGIDDGKAFSLSTIRFIDIVQTLASCDVFPVFIIDACFSGNSAPQNTGIITSQMHDFLRTYFAGSYALLASTSQDALSFENAFGGFFTREIHRLIMNGLGDKKGRHLPFITLESLSAPLQKELSISGKPLSKCYIAPDLPSVPISKNIKFKPDRERFAPYFKKIIQLAWNKGKPRNINRDLLLQKIGRGAYANHSKLSRAPWQLMEDTKKNITLTDRGIKFAKGELEIPDSIIRDAVSWDWISDPNGRMVKIDDIKNKENVSKVKISISSKNKPRIR